MAANSAIFPFIFGRTSLFATRVEHKRCNGSDTRNQHNICHTTADGIRDSIDGTRQAYRWSKGANQRLNRVPVRKIKAFSTYFHPSETHTVTHRHAYKEKREINRRRNKTLTVPLRIGERLCLRSGRSNGRCSSGRRVPIRRRIWSWGKAGRWRLIRRQSSAVVHFFVG
jgi:hypothetical protein